MKLADLRPEWWAPPGRSGVAVIFTCPCCVGKPTRMRLVVPVQPPLDGGAPVPLGHDELFRHFKAGHLARSLPGEHYVPTSTIWDRAGATFDGLTLHPSVDASAAGHWHGFIVSGAVVP